MIRHVAPDGYGGSSSCADTKATRMPGRVSAAIRLSNALIPWPPATIRSEGEREPHPPIAKRLCDG
jgi:hypothetical protein